MVGGLQHFSVNPRSLGFGTKGFGAVQGSKEDTDEEVETSHIESVTIVTDVYVGKMLHKSCDVSHRICHHRHRTMGNSGILGGFLFP